MKLAFNKYNAPELLSQLLTVLTGAGLNDVVDHIKQSGIPRLVNKAWNDRNVKDLSFSRVAERHMKASGKALPSYYADMEKAFFQDCADQINKSVRGAGKASIHEGVRMSWVKYEGYDRSDHALEFSCLLISMDTRTTKLSVDFKSPYSGITSRDIAVPTNQVTPQFVADLFLERF